MISFGFKYGIPVDADFVADMRFLPNPLLGARAAAADRPRPRGRRLRARASPAPSEFLDGYVPVLEGVAEGYLARGQAVHDGRHRLHRRQAPQRRDDRGDRPAARATRGVRRRRRSTATSGGSERDRTARRPSVVALGGGHGLHASLSALRRVVDRPDRGRHRRRRRRLVRPAARASSACCRPATCGWRWPRCAATTSGAETWARVLQHRFAGDGEMRGHVVGNLLIVGLWELLGDHVAGARLGRPAARRPGRVLPMALTPAGHHRRRSAALDPATPTRVTTVRGQVEVATTDGHDRVGRARPGRPAGRAPRRSTRSATADWVVLGPGLVVHLGDPAPDGARAAPGARARPTRRVVVVLNLAPQAGETAGLRAGRPPRGAARARARTCGSTPCSPTAAASPTEPTSSSGVVAAATARGWSSPTSPPTTASPRHDPAKLAAAYAAIVIEAGDSRREG